MPLRLDDLLRRRGTLAFLWGAAVAVVALFVGRFWIPLDEGTLAQSAERVLRGQLPHRDFGDPYTGLNAFVGAAAFKLAGIQLSSLRLPLVGGFALWAPAVWLLARRCLPPTQALVAAGLAVTLSVLAYPAAMPTWFALFAVTWGGWFLVRAIQDGRGRERRWLMAAGAMAGVAILFKIVGVYFLACAFLVVAWHRADHARAYVAVAVLGGGLFLLLLGRLTLPATGVAGVYHLFLPSLAAVLLLFVRVRRPNPPEVPERGLLPLVTDGGALLLGALAPVAVFLFPYLLAGDLAAWTEGVLLLPARRLDAAASPPGSAWTIAPGAVAVLLAVVAARLSSRGEQILALFGAGFLAVGLLLDDAADGAVMSVLWYALRGWIPAVTVAGALYLGRSPRKDDGPAFALLVAAATWSLVQFPYAAPAYFFYVAPLAVLATAALLRAGLLRAGPVLGLLAAIFLFLGAGYAAGTVGPASRPLALDRGGIRVDATEAELYERLVGLVREHAGAAGLWAGPDAPEVYFLAGIPNPTPTLYEFLDPSPRTSGDLARLFADKDIDVAVVNTRPLFSPPLDAPSLELILDAFPRSRTVGHFVVRWREAP